MEIAFSRLPIGARFRLPPLQSAYVKTSETTYGLRDEPLWDIQDPHTPVALVVSARPARTLAQTLASC